MKMKYILIATLCFSFVYACNNTAKTGDNKTATEEPDECKQEDKLTPTLVNGFYGAEFDITNPSTLENAVKTYKENGSKSAKISGTIEAICQSKGCWFDLKGESTTQTIDFGHKFLMHKDLAGKKVIAMGEFYNDTTSVEQQIHEAVDDAKSMSLEEAKKKFTTPLINTGFQATGIKIVD